MGLLTARVEKGEGSLRLNQRWLQRRQDEVNFDLSYHKFMLDPEHSVVFWHTHILEGNSLNLDLGWV